MVRIIPKFDIEHIDVTFDFTEDTPRFWDNFWNNNEGLGAGTNDPDIQSKTLQRYHKLLWSKELPNGEYMDLTIGSGAKYLTWSDFRFGSDSITASFRYRGYRHMIEKVMSTLRDYHRFMENYLRKSYTIGGSIIFPKWHGGMNQSRGCNPQIRDRWDLTLECIRRHYHGEESPLSKTLEKDREFFNLFVDFKGYVDFFYLQDCVSNNYDKVVFWLGEGDFSQNPLPQTVDEYLQWINQNLDFVDSRNTRIETDCKNRGLKTKNLQTTQFK